MLAVGQRHKATGGPRAATSLSQAAFRKASSLQYTYCMRYVPADGCFVQGVVGWTKLPRHGQEVKDLSEFGRFTSLINILRIYIRKRAEEKEENY